MEQELIGFDGSDILHRDVLFKLKRDEQGTGHATKIRPQQPFHLSLLVALWFVMAIGASYWLLQIPIEWVLYYAAINVVALLIVLHDRWALAAHKPITSESSLLFISLLGGWPVLILGHYVGNFPKNSPLYRLLLTLVVLGHIGGFAWLLSPPGYQWFNDVIQQGMTLLAQL